MEAKRTVLVRYEGSATGPEPEAAVIEEEAAPEPPAEDDPFSALDALGGDEPAPDAEVALDGLGEDGLGEDEDASADRTMVGFAPPMPPEPPTRPAASSVRSEPVSRSSATTSTVDAAELRQLRTRITELESAAQDGVARRKDGLTVTPYDLPDGCVGGYYPELNVLIPVSHYALESKTPAAKTVPVRIVKLPTFQSPPSWRITRVAVVGTVIIASRRRRVSKTGSAALALKLTDTRGVARPVSRNARGLVQVGLIHTERSR